MGAIVIHDNLSELNEIAKNKKVKKTVRRVTKANAEDIKERLDALKGIINELRNTYVVPMQVTAPALVEPLAVEDVELEF